MWFDQNSGWGICLCHMPVVSGWGICLSHGCCLSLFRWLKTHTHTHNFFFSFFSPIKVFNDNPLTSPVRVSVSWHIYFSHKCRLTSACTSIKLAHECVYSHTHMDTQTQCFITYLCAMFTGGLVLIHELMHIMFFSEDGLCWIHYCCRIYFVISL